MVLLTLVPLGLKIYVLCNSNDFESNHLLLSKNCDSQAELAQFFSAPNFAVSGKGPATGSMETDTQEVCYRERPWTVGIAAPTAKGRMVRQLLFVRTTQHHRMSFCQTNTGLEDARLVFHILGVGKRSN